MNKINKKIILGFAMSMIFSLAIMQGVSQKNVQTQDMNLQQASIGAAYMATQTEYGAGGQVFWGTTATILTSQTTSMAGPCAVAGPIGWGVLAIYGL